MGTTVTAAWFLRGEMAWVHVGDSRLYLLREERLSQVSRDHTRGEFAERDGLPLPYAPGALTQNFIFGSRGLDDDDEIRVDKGRDTGTLALQPGDRILLTSDGVHGFLDEEQIMAGLSSDSATGAARWLVDEAMTCGSDDNVTAVVVFVGAVTDTSATASLWSS
jgi:protein phosphatase